MNTRPTLYINRVTTVDCAILSQWGVLQNTVSFAEALGFSFNVDVELSGRLDPIENVVVDFGALKKFLKSEIDNIDYGYDHKLIVPSAMLQSKDGIVVEVTDKVVTITNHTNMLLQVPNNAVKFTQTDELDERLSQSTGFIESLVYREFDKKGSYESFGQYGSDEVLLALGLELKVFLQACVNRQYPDQDIKIETVICDCETTKPNRHKLLEIGAWENIPVASNYFSYTHGLKNSTSMGCRNIVHGHLSYIQLVGAKQSTVNEDKKAESVAYKQKLELLSETIASELNCTHFVHRENVVSTEAGTFDSYTAVGRGGFTTQIRGIESINYQNKSDSDILFSRIAILETESTIENLVGYVVDKYRKQLEELKINAIYVSEGLHKGSYVNIN